MIFLTEVVKFELDQLAQASQISPGRVLQATNTSNNEKEPFLSPYLPLNPPPTPPTSSSTTTDHRIIFKTELKDSVENEASNPYFVVSSSMRFMLLEDLGNVNLGHEFICMYVECDCL
ncbi:hypothetical protein HKD37_12G033927 [Glycine soja]